MNDDAAGAESGDAEPELRAWHDAAKHAVHRIGQHLGYLTRQIRFGVFQIDRERLVKFEQTLQTISRGAFFRRTRQRFESLSTLADVRTGDVAAFLVGETGAFQARIDAVDGALVDVVAFRDVVVPIWLQLGVLDASN